MQFECDKMGSFELGWWRFDHLIFKNLASSSTGNYIILNHVPIICFSYAQLTVGFAFQGGIFVMEPQPWKSYENNRRVSEVCIYTNFFVIAQVS